ncbi:chromosome condensation protein CrcB [Halomonas sp. ZH2S]|uniref:Fluoride-specific ion channel FluC n=2 Tax=Vreelandella zhuhanensis TaxID=2684210 RepID=A0A7X3KR73_9GAMM|nr:chromosome condensation protein CrcB [Halomonas zhuhanensis]
MIYLAVGLGSALGTGSRYLVSIVSLNLFGAYFPWGTLGVNLLGSALIAGVVTAAYSQGFLTRWQPFLVAGFCGGFTTFSLFSLEVFVLWQGDDAFLAVIYALGSPFLWLGAAWCGQRLAKRQAI